MVFKTKPGGINTNKNGLKFEQEMSFEKLILNIKGYKIESNNIFFKGNKVAEFYHHDRFRIDFLKPRGIIMEKIISKNLKPDTAVFVLKGNTIYILEVKYQGGGGSVDEKLQAGKFKKLQYERLLKGTGLKVEFYFILSDFFLNKKYKDVLNFIKAEGCDYFFGELPLDYLGLPSE